MIDLIIAAMIHPTTPAELAPIETVTVDGVEYPVCAEEDCSDQVGQVGVWTSNRTGRSYLIIGEDLSIEVTP